MKKWKAPKRNWKDIQFESLRRLVDPTFNEAHDALSKAFYEKKSFIWKGKNWGILDKEMFDKLHGLVFQLRALAFHEENKKQPKKSQIPEEEYNNVYDAKGKLVERNTDLALARVKSLKEEGIELEI